MKLPDEVFTQLTYMLEQGEKWQWKIGRFINEVWEEVQPYVILKAGETHTQAIRREHAFLIRSLAEGTGADRSTLNDRQNMATFFSVANREKYHMLTYSQLRACKSEGEDWETWADWALTNGFHGRPAGVHTIRKAQALKKNPEFMWVRNLRKIEELAEKIMHDQDTPWYVYGGMENVLLILEQIKTEKQAEVT